MEYRTSRMLKTACREGIFPGASLLVARGEEVLYEQVIGLARVVPTALELRSTARFDVASLTKPLVTTSLAMLAVDRDAVDLREPLSARLPVGEPWATMTPWHLLAHASGLASWRPLYLELEQAQERREVGQTRQEIRAWMRRQVVAQDPVYAQGERSLYSDLGFMLLDWWLEAVHGDRLDRVFAREIAEPLGCASSEFVDLDVPPKHPAEQYVATEACSWRGRLLQGEVHDQNTFAMGGISGQAGLFTTARDVHRLLLELHRAWNGDPSLFGTETVRAFWRPSGVPGSAFRLGWDGPSAKGYRSAGHHFGPHAVGHLGFTGCSIWLEPEQGYWIVLLSNRVHPRTDNQQIRQFRPLLHDLVTNEWPP